MHIGVLILSKLLPNFSKPIVNLCIRNILLFVYLGMASVTYYVIISTFHAINQPQLYGAFSFRFGRRQVRCESKMKTCQ